MPLQPDIVSQMVTQLGIVEPDLDTSVGTTVRNILDVVAEAVSEAYTDGYFGGYNYDIDTLSGSKLDSFLLVFGFTRFSAKRATGTVTLSRPTAAASPIFLPVNTIFADGSTPPNTFSTLVSVILPVGGTSIDVPVQAVTGGLAGNVAAAAISNFVTPLAGITGVSNAVGTSGGADAESDDAVRARFKATALRGYTGTEQMFLGVALEDTDVTQAKVTGSANTRREQIQLIGGVGQSTLRGALYVYDSNYFLGPDIAAGDILNPGVHYRFSPGGEAIPDPSSAPTVVFTPAVGGSANAPFSFCYTGVSASGETLPSPVTTVDVDATTAGRFVVTAPPLTGASSYNVYVMPPVLVGSTWVAGGTWYLWATITAMTPRVGPTILAYSTQSTGGDLAPGTYYYQLTGVTSSGESLPGPEFVVVVPTGTSTNQVSFTYSNVPDFKGTNVYRGATSGSEEKIVGTGYTFNGTVPGVPGAAVPGAGQINALVPNTLLAYVDAGQLATDSGSPVPTLDTTTNTVVFNLASPPSGVTPTSLPFQNDTGFQPIITSLDPVNCPDGIYDLQFDYVPNTSRNNPTLGITNKVDITVEGVRATPASESRVWSNGSPFNTTAGSPLNSSRFQRPDGSYARPGNYFQKLTFGPVISLPTTLTISSVVYALGEDYFLVNDYSPVGLTAQSNFGIEWATTANGAVHAPPTNGTQFSVDYDYNRVPRDVQVAIQGWRLVDYDVQVHQAKLAYLNVYMVVVLDPGFSLMGVQAAASTALEALFATINFGGTLQISDMLRTVAGVAGVASVRMTTFSDNPTLYAVQRVSSTGSLLRIAAQNGRAYDIVLTDDTVPVFNSLVLTEKAHNSYWGGDDGTPGFSPPSI